LKNEIDELLDIASENDKDEKDKQEKKIIEKLVDEKFTRDIYGTCTDENIEADLELIEMTVEDIVDK